MQKGALIGQGRTADVYAWGEGRILKLYQEHMPVHLVEQEYNVTRVAQASGIPVPAADQPIEVDGRCGIIFERLDGPSMLKALAIKPWRIIEMARLLGELHARVHACTAPPELPSQKQQIENGIQAAKDLPPKIKAAALACLTQLPQGNSLCHGDFHPDNVLMTSRGPVIIDWMTGTGGNPLADVCRTLLIFETTALPAGSPIHLRLLAKTFGNLIETIYRKRYLQIRPTSRIQIDAWWLPLMAARLREVEEYPNENQLLMARINTIISG
jgi:aminoglycoside phosphotransferase (APT) family kinase protein